MRDSSELLLHTQDFAVKPSLARSQTQASIHATALVGHTQTFKTGESRPGAAFIAGYLWWARLFKRCTKSLFRAYKGCHLQGIFSATVIVTQHGLLLSKRIIQCNINVLAL